MRYTFQAEQWLPYPVEAVFAFFVNPQNLPPLLPAWQKARVEEAVLVSPPERVSKYRLRGVAAGEGSRVTISLRPFPFSPLRIPWEAMITGFAWNEFFCDEQEQGRGPFAYWKHCHRVSEAGRDGVSGTLVTDEVEYEPPFGRAGERLHRLLRWQIEKTFSYRQRRVAEILGRVLPAPVAAGTTVK